MKNQEDYFKVLRKIQQNPSSSQRELAEDIGFSLGKLNYCLKALKNKGLIKIKNFKNNPDKLNYVYILTPKGMSEKTKLTLNFMKKKMKEYDDLKKELEN
jgi:EPS-associated MarR family transcriptional regulator